MAVHNLCRSLKQLTIEGDRSMHIKLLFYFSIRIELIKRKLDRGFALAVARLSLY